MDQTEKKPDERLLYEWDNKTILVVEDVETSNRYFEAALKRTNARVLWSKNGAEAIDAVKQHPEIDVVLMDIHMPVMNGFEATREIRKIRKDLTIIVQTAYVLSGEREKSFEAGCDAFITKPINFKLLLSTIDKYI